MSIFDPARLAAALSKHDAARAVAILDELEDVQRELREALADGEVTVAEAFEIGVEVVQLAGVLLMPAFGSPATREGKTAREERRRLRRQVRKERKAARQAAHESAAGGEG